MTTNINITQTWWRLLSAVGSTLTTPLTTSDMNTTEYFKRTIQAYLEERAMEDELFAAKSREPICPTITVSDSWTKNKPN